jgi:predicted negative regulator of RcsB-dependent stress response
LTRTRQILFLNILDQMAKRVKVSRKEFLKGEDQFLTTSQKVTAYMSDHGPLMLTSAGIVILLFALFAGYRYNQQRQDMRMENLYFQMVKINKDKAENKTENVIGELQKLLVQFQEGPQKTRASLLLAEEYFKVEQYDKAIVIYSEISDRLNEKDLSGQLARMGLAYSHEGKKEYKKAAVIYKTILGNENGLPLFDVYMGLARCYELDKDKQNALTTLREMENKYQDHPQIESVKRRISKLSGQA